MPNFKKIIDILSKTYHAVETPEPLPREFRVTSQYIAYAIGGRQPKPHTQKTWLIDCSVHPILLDRITRTLTLREHTFCSGQYRVPLDYMTSFERVTSNLVNIFSLSFVKQSLVSYQRPVDRNLTKSWSVFMAPVRTIGLGDLACCYNGAVVAACRILHSAIATRFAKDSSYGRISTSVCGFISVTPTTNRPTCGGPLCGLIHPVAQSRGLARVMAQNSIPCENNLVPQQWINIVLFSGKLHKRCL